MTKIRLGVSQGRVYSYLRDTGPATAQEVGDALWEEVSRCSPHGVEAMHLTNPIDKVRRRWAYNLLHNLLAKNLVTKNGDYWSIIRADDVE